MSRLTLFLNQLLISPPLKAFWEHSVAVGVCAEQLSYYSKQNVGAAMIAGLLHDIGQLWMLRFEHEAYQPVWDAAMECEQDICDAEREAFGVDHGVVGAWLAEIWSLPKPLKSAIRWHHAPDKALLEPLVPLVHIAEVLSHALELTTGRARPVRYLSQKCCEALDITWGANCYSLFGRIEACARHAMKFFQTPADSHRARYY
jgi:putative nucleotidyltransferase with HDIG domain